MSKILGLIVLFFGALQVAVAAPEKDVHLDYDLVQAYDGFGGYYVEADNGDVYTNVGYEGLNKATKYQWNISVKGKGRPGAHPNQLLDGWIETTRIGSGYGFKRPVMYKTLLVHKTDPRYKHAIIAGPTPVDWAYVKYEVTYLGKGKGLNNPH